MSDQEWTVGSILNGKWKLTKLLGEGGMGRVFAAEGIHGEGSVAIKLLHPEFVTEPQILQRFENEAYAAQQFHHENVAQIFEHATDSSGVPYLVMELLNGISLAEYVVHGKQIPASQAAPIVYNVLQALQAAHEKGIIHRDLKPDNVFLVPDPRGRYTVKVLDFGIAKVMDLAGGMGNKTKTGVMLGTPGYMSPEQIKNAKEVGPRSDLWSVGVMFYEMLTGDEPFTAPNDFAKLTAVLTQDPRPVHDIDPNLEGWSHFFFKALARNPENRFQSAKEMAMVLLTTARTIAGAAPLPTAEFRSIDVQAQPPVRESFHAPPASSEYRQSQAPSTLSSAPSPAQASPARAPAAQQVDLAATLRAEDGQRLRASAASIPRKTKPLIIVLAVGVGVVIGLVIGVLVGWFAASGL